MDVKPAHLPQALTDAAKGAAEVLSDLTRQEIQLARLELRHELKTRFERTAWIAAGTLTAAAAGLVLLAAVFSLLGYLIDSVGWRLLILAAVLGITSFALILRASVMQGPTGGAGNG